MTSSETEESAAGVFWPKRQQHSLRKWVHRLRVGRMQPWLIPLLYALAAIAAGLTIPRYTTIFLPKFVSTMSVGAAIGIYSAIASGMIALTGIVFSLAFVMVQFSATAYSPRLVLWIARDPVMSHALGIFTATFLMPSQRSLGSTETTRVEFLSAACG